MFTYANQEEHNDVQNCMNMLDNWSLSASGDGCFWVQPRKSVLKLQEVCGLLKRIHRTFSDTRFNVMVFHFDGVVAHRSLWLIVLRLLTAFAKSMGCDCRIIRAESEARRIDTPAIPSVKEVGPASAPRSSQMMLLNGVCVVIESKAAGARLARGSACQN